MCHLTVPSCRSEVQGHCSCIRCSGSYRAGVKVLAGPQFSPGALPAHWLLAESFSYHCRTEVPISLLGVSHRPLSASVDVHIPYHGTLSIFKPIMTSNSSQTLNESLTSFSVLSWRREEPRRFFCFVPSQPSLCPQQVATVVLFETGQIQSAFYSNHNILPFFFFF